MTSLRHPEALFLLVLVPGFLFWRWRLTHRGVGALRHPVAAHLPRRVFVWPNLVFLLQAGVLTLLVVALARPQRVVPGEEVTEGVDIMVALDTSGSMDARDFLPHNRLEVAKQVVADFIRARQYDRVGLVVFSAKAVTRCPLTTDHEALLELADTTRLKMLPEGTAIGSALATAVNRLRLSRAKSRLVVLVTDGVNNTGEIDPLTAADLAASLGVKVYTVGVGREGVAPITLTDPRTGQSQLVQMEVDIDEETLSAIARRTGGSYFRATDPAALQNIFQRIDALEKSEIRVKRPTEYRELFPPYALAGLLLLALAVIAAETVLRSVP